MRVIAEPAQLSEVRDFFLIHCFSLHLTYKERGASIPLTTDTVGGVVIRDAYNLFCRCETLVRTGRNKTGQKPRMLLSAAMPHDAFLSSFRSFAQSLLSATIPKRARSPDFFLRC